MWIVCFGLYYILWLILFVFVCIINVRLSIVIIEVIGGKKSGSLKGSKNKIGRFFDELV